MRRRALVAAAALAAFAPPSSARAMFAPTDWMASLDPALSLTALTIPGTHDSGARFEITIGLLIAVDYVDAALAQAIYSVNFQR